MREKHIREKRILKKFWIIFFKKLFKMLKLKTLGQGTYGKVYKAENIEPEKHTIVAIKRNFKDSTSSWIGNLRELSFLTVS